MLKPLRLQHLELKISEPQPWLGGLLADLSHCPTLERFKLVGHKPHSEKESLSLPDLDLHAMPKLKHVELEGWFPNHDFSLPPDCLLRLHVACWPTLLWEQHSDSIRLHTTVLWLAEGVPYWPRFQGFQNLQYLFLEQWECGHMEALDLGDLKDIPHVRMYLVGHTEFSLSAGSWQSLEIAGIQGFSIAFSDADAFVRGTTFLFAIFEAQDAAYEDLKRALQVACSKNAVDFYDFEQEVCFDDDVINNNYSCIVFSNKKDIVRDYLVICNDEVGMYPEADFGGKYLVSEERFWPCDPFAALPGTGP